MLHGALLDPYVGPSNVVPEETGNGITAAVSDITESGTLQRG